jgi:DMSO/TMAO reductase YedYZ molybdopterin-dependent catalytic subunit
MSLYSPANDPKYQPDHIEIPSDLANAVVISNDTRRAERLPHGQHRTRKWPVLHASSVPELNAEDWSLSIHGLVDRDLKWTLQEFRQLPRTQVFADFHCVTTWSRLGNLWEGVSLPLLFERVGIQATAGFAVIAAADDGWTTNLPLSSLLQPDVILADTHDGMALDADHGGPVRLVVPQLFAWKSAKWIQSIELTVSDQPGYWEQAGYHNVGDPWLGQRYRDDPDWLALHGDVE